MVTLNSRHPETGEDLYPYDEMCDMEKLAGVNLFTGHPPSIGALCSAANRVAVADLNPLQAETLKVINELIKAISAESIELARKERMAALELIEQYRFSKIELSQLVYELRELAGDNE